jgi:Uma2 family endonuclease
MAAPHLPESYGTWISVADYLDSVFEPDRDYVDGALEERNAGEWDHAELQLRLGAYLLGQYDSSGIRVATELRIRVTATRFRVPDISVFLKDPGERVPTQPPFLCIEILSPEDRMSRIEERITDYLRMGVPYVWVLDPQTRQAYVATPAEGLKEVRTGILATAEPQLQAPLAELFR